MTHKAMEYYKSLYYVRKIRPVASPNMGFAKQLLQFEKDLIAKRV